MADREGPRVRIDASCFGCRHNATEGYVCQSDSGSEVYCTHPQHGEPGKERRYIGDTRWRTPDWCPLLAAAIAALKAA